MDPGVIPRATADEAAAIEKLAGNATVTTQLRDSFVSFSHNLNTKY